MYFENLHERTYFPMRKVVKSIVALAMAAMTMMSATSVFAADYVNSVGSEATDIAILDNGEYTVAGQDTTQAKKSAYATVTATTDAQESNVDIYATIAEGSDVYDPDNPNADDDGFVDGTVLVGVPTTLILSGTANEEGYYVGEGRGKVKGNIAGTTVINVVPEATVTLSSTGKDDITADIEQDYTKFVVSTSEVTGADVNKNVTPDFNENAVFDVTVQTNQASAGSWHGSFTYNISLTDAA